MSRILGRLSLSWLSIFSHPGQVEDCWHLGPSAVQDSVCLLGPLTRQAEAVPAGRTAPSTEHKAGLGHKNGQDHRGIPRR